MVKDNSFCGVGVAYNAKIGGKLCWAWPITLKLKIRWDVGVADNAKIE